ncbi:hypothetical protein Dsin_031617 [Dipteronia sinensis]|uniref:RNase H type-1 domain-containing protein n=1 Tax=Dipteronia sinensis TaxID=43782 RepID=A0AAD9ZLQ2_9ROSI|nr:hypothetical protein Dsin_031617 [Dipteronia sinensis]
MVLPFAEGDSIVVLLHEWSENNTRMVADSANSTSPEAMAMLRGLNFALDSGLFPCTLESDAKVIVDLINANNVPYSDVGLITGDICNFLITNPGCNVVFASRKANMAAHSLAKLGLNYACKRFKMEEVPVRARVAIAQV